MLFLLYFWKRVSKTKGDCKSWPFPHPWRFFRFQSKLDFPVEHWSLILLNLLEFWGKVVCATTEWLFEQAWPNVQRFQTEPYPMKGANDCEWMVSSHPNMMPPAIFKCFIPAGCRKAKTGSLLWGINKCCHETHDWIMIYYGPQL